MTELDSRYDYVSARHRQRFGWAPEKPLEPKDVAKVNRLMVEALNGRRDPKAAAPVAVGHRLLVTVGADGQFAVEADLVDAAGLHAGRLQVHPTLAAGERELAASVVALARAKAQEQLL